MTNYNVKELLSDVKISGISPFRSLDEALWSDIPFWIPTGAISLDYGIGGYRRGFKGGIPAGRCTEIYGHESSGKSALLDHVIKNFLEEHDGIVLLGDREHAHEEDRLTQIGIKSDNLVFIEIPNDELTIKKRQTVSDFTLEEFFQVGNMAFKKIRKEYPQVPILMALDSLAATPTNAQQAAIMSDGAKGEDFESMNMKEKLDKAAVMSAMFPTFCDLITKSGATLIIVNQLRTKPNYQFGDPSYAPGGDTLPFQASLRIRLSKDEEIKPDKDPTRTHWGDDPVGLKIKFKIIKNKVAPPLRKGNFPLFFDDRGILNELCFADFLVDRKMWEHNKDFEKSGAWYSWKGERVGQGTTKMAATFIEDPELMKEIEAEILGGEAKEEE